MKFSQTPRFIKKEFPRDEDSYNAKILVRAGYVDKTMAGVYSFLPLGLRMLKKIEEVVRYHMNALGAQEILMPTLSPKENWQKTGRWEGLEILFKVRSRENKEYALGPTHEEIVVPLAQKAIFSYKDLPIGLYQIQNKFRDEPRPRSGLLRGREFLMKDLYSFHVSPEDLKKYYNRAAVAYKKIFSDLGLEAVITEASGGTFSKYSHEFQVVLEGGEDAIFICAKCGFARNKEISSSAEKEKCAKCGGAVEGKKSAEVGNIFQLNRKYSDPFSMAFKDQDGKLQPVYMGCYGIGVSRLMGVIAEKFHDGKGLVLPKEVAPFQVHLISLLTADEKDGIKIKKRADEIYKRLITLGVEVLYDDRDEISAGEKFAEADILGMPLRAVVSRKTGTKIEVKERVSKSGKLVDFLWLKNYCVGKRKQKKYESF